MRHHPPRRLVTRYLAIFVRSLWQESVSNDNLFAHGHCYPCWCIDFHLQTQYPLLSSTKRFRSDPLKTPLTRTPGFLRKLEVFFGLALVNPTSLLVERVLQPVSLSISLRPWLVLLFTTRVTPLNCRVPIAFRWRSSSCCISFFLIKA